MRRTEHVSEGWLLTRAESDNADSMLYRRHGGDVAWSRGNAAEPLIDGAEYFGRLRDELSDVGAGDRVLVAVWSAEPDQRLAPSGASLRECLHAAVERGAEVVANVWCPYFYNRRGFARDNHHFAEALRRLGATVLLDQRVRLAGSHHQKFMVVRRPRRPEHDVAFVGGIDPCASRRDSPAHHGDPQVQGSISGVFGQRPAWHDAHLEIRGPSVGDVEHCFWERWNDAQRSRRRILFPHGGYASSDLTRLPKLPDPPPVGQCSLQLLRTYPRKHSSYSFARSGEHSIALGYAKALRRARDYIYVEDQFLWSPLVVDLFAEALRRNPDLRLITVVAHSPDKSGRLQDGVHAHARSRAYERLRAEGGERFSCFSLESRSGRPIHVHSKICIVDDAWASIGSANLNRRSWTYDSELAAAVVDTGESRRETSFARALRMRLWSEHLGSTIGDDQDPELCSPERGVAALHRAATRLDTWHAAGRIGPRPVGHLRHHTPPSPSRWTRLWAGVASYLLVDPDGRAFTRNDT